MADMNIQNTEIDESILKEDPVTQRVIKMTQEEEAKITPLIEGMLEDFQKRITNDEYTVHEIIHALGKTIVYTTQMLSKDYEDFSRAYDKASSIVANNILPSLGIYVATEEDKSLNENGIVTYNGNYDEENFLVRNMIMDAGALIDMIYWRIKMAIATKDIIEEESENNVE